MSKVPPAKKKVVESLVKLMEENPIIGTVNMENMPTPQLQKMREQLRDKVKIIMSKKRLISIALDEAEKKKKGIKELEKHMTGMPALIFTEENPFKLFKTLKKSKSTAPAKAGQTAPNDIVVSAGPTSFAPGPIIGELSSIGVKAGIEGGKVVIKEDAVAVKEGQEIDGKTAELLSRLGIEPMEIGLDLTATYEEGTIFTKSILDIDEEEFMQNIQDCARKSFNLAMEAGIPNQETLPMLISKSFNEAKGLALEENILTDETASDVLAKAEAQAKSLDSKLDTEPAKQGEEAPKE
ncbi:MAG: 50S ribosomal protein L10 [Nanobdellota archaeon]